jgi:diguanylate cyclase (GGDEF)-like protein
MQATSLTSRFRRDVGVGRWAWWRLPVALRCYVATVALGGAVAIGVAAYYTQWHTQDIAKFLLLMCCAVISVASNPRIVYTSTGLTRDFTTIWVLPTAILLPPVYAALISIPMYATLHLWVHRGVVHRTVFTAASISICYAMASMVFHLLPGSFAGGSVGSGMHAFTWALSVAGCYVLGGRAQHFMIFGAVKLSNPSARVLRMDWNRDALQGLFIEVDLCVLITLAVALSPALVLVAVPTVLLVRVFLVHPVLVAQSRVDAKTGLLNVSTWETEAQVELSRTVRTRNALALAILDIDHFKLVNDTYGHLVGDRVLKAVADAIMGQSRDYDKVGRFGGEEFVLLLAQADEDDACRIAERLRIHIGELAVPIDDRPEAPRVRVTISIGVSAMERNQPRDLTDLLTAADSALYQAKQTGRNRVCVAGPVRPGEFAAEITARLDTAAVATASAGGIQHLDAGCLGTVRLDAPPAGNGTAAGHGTHAGNGAHAGNAGNGTAAAPSQRSSVRSDPAGASLCPQRLL